MERSRKGGIKKAGGYYEVTLSADDLNTCFDKALHGSLIPVMDHLIYVD